MNELELQSPLYPRGINQFFGQNKHPAYKGMGLTGHNGLDFYATHGQPLYASHDGWASFQIDGGGGHGVVIITDKEFGYGGVPTYFKTIYWHLCDSTKEPQFKSPLEDKTPFTFVKKGEVIGYADNTGISTGDHLHYGLKPVAKGEGWGTWFNTQQNNGYKGCIDPLPFMSHDITSIPVYPPAKNTSLFTKDLRIGTVDEEVRNLQKLLNKLNFTLATIGPGSPGNETNFYGNLTRQAVVKFQTLLSIYPSDGQFGDRTRSFANLLLIIG